MDINRHCKLKGTCFRTGSDFKTLEMKNYFLLALLLLLILLSACSTSRQSRVQTAEAIANTHATTIDKSLQGATIPNVTVSGSSNVVTVAPLPVKQSLTVADNVNTSGTATGDFASSFKFTFSTWIALGFAAIAVAALLFAWVFWSKASATGATADKAFSGAIDTVHTLSSGVITPEVAQALATIRADLEKRRGQSAKK